MKKAIAIFCVLVLALSCVLGACSGSKSSGSSTGGSGEAAPSDAAAYVGEWKAVKTVFMGEETPADEVFEGSFAFTLREDNTATLNFDGDQEANNVWAVSSDGVRIGTDGDAMDFVYEGGALTYTTLGMKIVCEKQ